MEAIPDLKWKASYSAMSLDIMGKLSKWEKIGPVVLLVVTEDLKKLFNFLVNVFSFSISLRMVGSGQRLLNVQFFSCFLHYFGGKLRALV